MLFVRKKIVSLRFRLKGTMAEGLGRGLQNLRRRFESVWYLKKNLLIRTLQK